jgi:hypothetical protein
MMTTYKTIHHCLDKPAYLSRGEALRILYSNMVRREVLDTRLGPYPCAFHPTHYHLGKARERRICLNS